MASFNESEKRKMTEDDCQRFQVTKRPHLNKGTSFTDSERAAHGIRGLYPGGEQPTLELKVSVAMAQLRSKVTPLDRYIFLHTIQDSDETLYHAIIFEHLIEVMPFVYTPTVGEACIKWSHIHRQTVRGLYISLKDAGSVRSLLDNYPNTDIEAIVVTDGEAILGLGDLGANGMGISVGKLALYTGCAGISPEKCLPVHIDVGTNNKEYLADPAYLGLRQERVRGDQFFALVAEFIEACKDKYGRTVLIQFEDFGNATCFKVLEQHRLTANCFNDDVQGTASVVLGGLISAFPITPLPKISQHKFLFYGAGAAGVGIADLIALAIQRDDPSLSLEQAKQRISLVDSKGLVTTDRGGKIEDHKLPYAQPFTGNKERVLKSAAGGGDLLSIVQELRPTVIIGVSAQAGAFSEAVCEAMAAINQRPIIFALSNPTTLTEVTPQNAYKWTDGRCIYSSGSPFPATTLPDGRFFKPGQGNNAYIFPGLGLGCIMAGSTHITDDDFLIASKTLASMVTAADIEVGSVYPGLDRIRDVSVSIAAAVAENIFSTDRNTLPRPAGELLEACKAHMYVPKY